MPKKRNDPEHQLQKSLFDYVNKVLPALRPFIFAIPNGGHRDVRVAKKLKAEGVTSGVWDIFVTLPNLIKHGLYIECKSGKNELTNNQEEFRANVAPVGYSFAECRSTEDFEAILCDYFELERLTNKEIKLRIDCEVCVQRGYKQ
ncbi:MAG: VRR-NUC domain protein [Candidatus Methanofastidiosum methylothiophilum]|uniref:VRR-NUC domain protein n=1 Tax=Candidatus Methanofastidiosum methylothiophilum TaxID=1705564 RepID=A0A150J612_9EURY|nr:MAG: VRR-NUC domain protein [Candidatus Methanofastidiosum methylthiophilus]